MTDDYNSKKLNYQLQQMAFQKYPFEINNKTFYCLQTYFENQLLNGVDLQLKQAKGITPQPQKIAYLQQYNQIIMFIGSNIVSFNAQKRSYALITEVIGFVQILRTYTSKLSNRTYIFWLQSQKEDQNIKLTAQSKTNINSKIDNKPQRQEKKKITSILDFGKLSEINKLKRQDQIVEDNPQTGVTSMQQRQLERKKVHFKQQKGVQKQIKKVRIQQPSQPSQSINEIEQNNNNNNNNKKRFSICVFDYERKVFLHRQWLEIEQQQVINQIFIYFMTQKMVGYIVNDQDEERGKIYYKRIKLDQPATNPKLTTKNLLMRKKYSKPKRCDKFNSINSIMQIPMLKYNGQTDQYLFKSNNTVYSLQIYQLQHEIIVNQTNTKNQSKKQSKKSLKTKKQPQSNNKLQQQQHQKRNSLQVMNELDIEQLSRQIENLATKMKNSLITQQDIKPREKFSVKVCEQIQLLTEQNIIDIGLSEVYLVVLTQQFIRFYSIFNLNTLLFKSQIFNFKQLPPPINIELNKSYLLITHQNSTLISSYTIFQRKLKYNATCQVEIEHCQSILRIFMNSYNCEVSLLARQFQIQGRITNLLKSKRVISSPANSYKKTFIDISLAYINFSSTKCEALQLYLKNQRFRNILVCKWHSEYLIQTQNQIIAKEWRESFENMRCSCIHPAGQYLIIGFADCFKIYAITQQGLQNTFMTDVVKDCQTITYSEYGDQFAVGNGNNITIYGSYDCSKRYSILLSVGSVIQNLEFRGYNLICTLRSKKIIVYHSQLRYKEVFSFNPKQYLNENKHEISKKSGQSAQNLMKLTIKTLVSIEIFSEFYDSQLNVLIFSSGQKIFFLNTLTNQSLGSFQLKPISTMEYNKQLATLFLGTFDGELIAFPWPNKPSNILSILPQFRFHSSKITKIKITSDFKYLITIGADMAIYTSNIHYILNLKKLKGNEIAEYKSNKSAVTYCNFLKSKGICQFSHSQNTQKLQVKKQLQEQVVNTVFMLPEQRLKQKQNLLQMITVTKNQLNQQNLKQYEPLQQQSSSLRNRIYEIKQELSNLKRLKAFALENEKKKHQQETSDLLNKYSEMNYESRLLKLQFEEKIQKIKQQNQKEYEELKKQHEQKQKELLNQIQFKQQQTQKEKNNFYELDLIDEEKQVILQQQLESFQKQVELNNQKNGQLSCKNSTIQKQIHLLKYRIQELKFVIINANYSIEKLQGKQKKQKQEKIVFQNLLLENAKINVSQMEKKYIKATKELIQKNKVIDINLILYEKEKEILVTLEKTVEKTESQIDRIVDALQQEKQFRKFLIQKCTDSKQRLKEFTELKINRKLKLNKGKADLKNFVNQLHELEKQLESCLQSNKREKTSQTSEVLKKLKQLEQFGIKRPKVKSKQERQPRESEQSLQRNQQRRKTEMTQGQQFQRRDEKRKSNAYGQIMGNLKKSSNNLMKDKKAKKLRCSTEQREIIFMNKDELIKKVNAENKTCEVFKIDHKKKFQQQFGKYRKDKLLNTITGNFKQFTQRKQSPSMKILQKASSKYYNMKTQGNFKTQRFSNNSIAHNNSPSKKPQLLSNTYRDSMSNNIGRNYDAERLMERKKKNVIKQLTTEDKMVNKINNDKKLFMTSKTRLNLQNQDLLNTYNSLTHENKYYQNVVKAYQSTINQESHHYRLNPPHTQQSLRHFFSTINDSVIDHSKSNSKLNQSSNSKLYNPISNPIKQSNQKLTPFDQYIKNKESKFDQLKKNTSPQSQNDKKAGQQFLTTLSKLKKPQTSQQKRVKTVPCVEFNF